MLKTEKCEGDYAHGRGPYPAEPHAFLDKSRDSENGEKNDHDQRYQPDRNSLRYESDRNRQDAENFVEGWHSQTAEDGQRDHPKGDNPAKDDQRLIRADDRTDGFLRLLLATKFSAEELRNREAQDHPCNEITGRFLPVRDPKNKEECSDKPHDVRPLVQCLGRVGQFPPKGL